jgi:MFS family permease
MTTHPLVATLKGLKGNARGCVLTEPLWGIPYNLYAPYVSLYMLSLGLKDSQIGLIASIGLFFQILTASFSGILTDKLGRKKATLIFDLLSWSVSCLIWAVAHNFTYFVVAAIINSLWRVPSNSWMCLLVEDTDPGLLVDIYSWIYIAGLLAAFFAPFAGLLINTFSLVPTMRGLYLFTFVMMTAKFLIMNRMVTETRQGRVRMAQTENQGLLTLVSEYKGVLKLILKTTPTLYTIGIMLVLSTGLMISGTFWSILVTERLHIPPQDLGLYQLARSVIMLLFYFLVMPRLRGIDFKKPMLVGFIGAMISQLVLITIPEGSYFLLLVSILFESCSLAAVNTLTDKMIVVTVDEKERARIMAVIYVVVILFTSPFGWIAGNLSEINKILPFILRIILLAIGGLLTYLAARSTKTSAEPLEVASVS